jgi:hypothetical protein
LALHCVVLHWRGILAVFEFGRALEILECIMSLRSIIWAFDQQIFPSSNKFVLVALANYAGDTGQSFPDIWSLCEMTGQDVKTVRKALSKLVEDGVIRDTGNRTGPTGQIRVYQFPEVASLRRPKTVSFDPESRVEEDHKKTVKEGERLPKTDSLHIEEQLTVNGERLTKKEIVRGEPHEIPSHLRTPEVEAAWRDWVGNRREIKKPLTVRASAANFNLLRDWGPDKWVSSITASIANGWQGLFEPREVRNGFGNVKQLSGHDVDHSIPLKGWNNLTFDEPK